MRRGLATRALLLLALASSIADAAASAGDPAALAGGTPAASSGGFPSVSDRGGSGVREPGFSVRTWRTDEGLPSDAIRGIAQTSDGYIWVGTNAGLARFDGVRFHVLDHANTPALGSDECGPLFVDRDRVLWIATMGGGVSWMADGQVTSYGRSDGTAFEYIFTFLQDRSGRVWLGTDVGAHVWEGGKLRWLQEGSPQRDRATPLFCDDAGRIWFQNRAGKLGNARDGGITLASAAEAGIPEDITGSVRPHPGRDGTLWAVQGKPHRLWRIRAGEKRIFDLELTSSDDRIGQLLETSDGALWVATGRSGLRRVQGERVISVGQPEGLPSGPISILREDREGSLWAGTTGGLSRVTRRPFLALTSAEGLVSGRVWAVLEDSRGNLWIGTDTVLQRLHAGGVTTFDMSDGLPNFGVVSLAEDRSGTVWVGTTGGLARVAGDRIVAEDTHLGPARENVRALYVDRAGRLWIGTSDNGLIVREDGRYRAYTTKDGLGSTWVRFIHEDSAGDLWACTTGGLSRLRDGRLTTFTTREGLPSDMPLAVHEDRDGALWIGTYSRGLTRMKGGRLTTITSVQGLPDDTILRILEDDHDNFWISSPKGIYRVARESLNAVADGRERSVGVVRYGKLDGLPTTDCSGGTQPAGCRARDGALWFPTSAGLVQVAPASLAVNTIPPPVLVERVVHDGISVEGAQPAALPAGTKSVEVHYTALSFRAPERVRFSYRLEGFDPDWIDAGPRRVAYFTNLSPGAYRFRTRAANEDGVWNEEGAAIDIYVRPFVWQTAWFWTFVAVLAAAGLWGLHHLRLQQAERRFAAVLVERNRIARELHDTIAQGFTGVAMQLEAVASKLGGGAGEARESLDRARVLVRSGLADARRSVRDLRPLLLESGDLTESLRAVVAQLTEGTGVRAEVRVVGKPRRLSGVIEANLLRVGQEALTNAVRHGECKFVRAEIAFERRRVKMTIQDDGRGFAAAGTEAQPRGGLGLPGMRERMDQIGGSLEVASTPGGGTTVTASAPAVSAGWRR